jgi:hypothetical protein
MASGSGRGRSESEVKEVRCVAESPAGGIAALAVLLPDVVAAVAE